MRVLISGGAGYIGSVLTEMLLERGHQVTVLDRFFFGPTLADLEGSSSLRLLRADVRWVDPSVFDGVDAVLGLASISNDPAGELAPAATEAINHKGRARMAAMAKKAGVRRYVLASSCSVYGFQKELLDENSSVRPLTTYAQANIDAENSILPLHDQNFCVTALRQATVYGLSRRMRFDLAVNGMTLGAYRNGSIPVLRDGTQWRPMIHVRDTSRAFIEVLEAPAELVGGQVFNVGSDQQNFQILPLARQISEALGLEFEESFYGEPDHRSYRVSFAKFRRALGFEPSFDPAAAAVEIRDALAGDRVATGPQTRTVEWYRLLLEWKERLDSLQLEGRLL